MPTNDFLPFAGDATSGPNLLSQAAYAVDAQRLTGNQPGLARQELVNKVLRQASAIAAAAAQAIADVSGDNVLDDGTTAAIVASFKKAFSSFLQAGTGAVSRTVQSKLRDTVSLKEFGADPTGGTDSLAAFNNAGAVGLLVDIPRGTYLLSGFPVGKFFSSDPVRPVFVNYAPKEFGIFQPASDIHYADEGASIHRLADRVFIGAATEANGVNIAAQGDWLTAYQLSTGRSFGFIQSAQVAALNDNNAASTITSVFAAHTQHLTVGGAIGAISVAVNDGTNAGIYAFAQYVEAYRTNSSAGAAYGVEIDTVNKGGSIAQIDPYHQSSAEVVALQLAAGAELAAAGQWASSAAINIQYNNSTFDRGINFGATALNGCDGVTGTAIAIALAKGHMLRWFAGYGVPTADIYSINTTTAGSVEQIFQEDVVRFQTRSNNAAIFRVATVPNPANHLATMASASGGPVQFTANGTDANIDIQLVPKGTGSVWLGAYTAGVLVNAGYITVKDSGGTVRRLAVV